MLSALKSFEGGSLASVLFILTLIGIYTGAISGGGDSLFFGSLGMILGIPVIMLNFLAASPFAFLAPVGALVVLVYIVRLKEVVGDGVYLCILAGWMLIQLGV